MNWSQADFVRDGVKLHYWQKGAGAPLLLLHGITDNGACWGRTADALAGNYTVYALDQRGHGKSGAPAQGYAYDDYVADAVGLVRAVAGSNAIVMGHSFGGIIGLKLAADYPDVVRKLVAVDPPLFDIPRSMPPRILDQQRHDFFEWLRKLKPLSRGMLVETCRAQSPRWSADECEAWADSKLDASPRLWQKEGIPTRSDWRDWLKAIQCPTLLVYGEPALGGLVDDVKAAQVVGALRSGQAVQIANAGHSVHRDEFEPTVDAIMRFLQA